MADVSVFPRDYDLGLVPVSPSEGGITIVV